MHDLPLIFALVCFIIGIFPLPIKFNIVALGLAALTVSFIA